MIRKLTGQKLMNLDYTKVSVAIHFEKRSLAITFFLAFALALCGNAAQVMAHGGEDHGDEKPKTATTTAGVISRTARLGDFEMMLKHSPLEPDVVAGGRLFVTKFTTNEPASDANPAIEIESANGSITAIPIEKTNAVGSYIARIPALPEGSYTMRTKLTYGGETDTATFSGVEVAHQEPATTEGENSRTQTAAMVILLLLIALFLFGSLTYFARRTFKNKPLREETVSA